MNMTTNINVSTVSSAGDDTNLTAVLILLEGLSAAHRQEVLDSLEGVATFDDLKQYLLNSTSHCHEAGQTSSGVLRVLTGVAGRAGGTGGRGGGVFDLEETLMQYGEYRLRHWLIVYVSMIIFIVGLLGNSVSFIVLTRRSMRRMSTYVYLSVLAVTDTLVLTVGLFLVWVDELTGDNVRATSAWSCKILSVLSYMVSDYSAWLIIFVTADRYIAVCHPLRAAAICTRATAVKVILGLLIIGFTINANFLWTTDIRPYGSASQDITQSMLDGDSGKSVQKQWCYAAAGYERLVVDIWPWIDACLYSLIPFVTILAFNARIVQCVVAARRARSHLSSTSPHYNASASPQGPVPAVYLESPSSMKNVFNLRTRKRLARCSDLPSPSSSPSSAPAQSPASINRYTPSTSVNEVTAGRGPQTTSYTRTSPATASETNIKLSLMLVAISLTFVVTTLPMNITLIATAFWNPAVVVAGSDRAYESRARYKLAQTVTELLMYCNHSINFFLYCATGQKFRRELQALLAGCCCRLCPQTCRPLECSIPVTEACSQYSTRWPAVAAGAQSNSCRDVNLGGRNVEGHKMVVYTSCRGSNMAIVSNPDLKVRDKSVTIKDGDLTKRLG